jgi:hypothetical protein
MCTTRGEKVAIARRARRMPEAIARGTRREQNQICTMRALTFPLG